MKKLLIRIIIAMLLPLSFIACGNDDEPEVVKADPVAEKQSETPEVSETPNPGDDPGVYEVNMVPDAHPIDLNEGQRILVERNNDFAFNLFRKVYAKYGAKSIGCSPLSVSYVLGMLNAGAQGQTSDEIASLLGYGQGNKGMIDDFSRTMMEELPLADPSATLRVANSVFVNHDVLLEDAYRQQMEANYHAKVSSLDFSRSDALDAINAWCNEQTEGSIPVIIDKLDASMAFMLLNATYFKATWAERFEPEAAKLAAFKSSDGSSTMLPMLHWHGDIWYSSNDLYTTINLPYGSGDNWSMMVLLPQEGKSIDEVLSSLSAETWKANLKKRQLYLIDAKMPKFTMQSDFTLNDILRDMGVWTMFDPEQADFSPMTKNLKKSEGHSLFVNLVKQKTGFSVTEEGTELTSVTINGGIHGIAFSGKTADFHADRPFVYLIQEASTGVIFFIGTFRGD